MSKSIVNTLLATLFALILMLALPVISFAQGRGNGRGQGANLDKKCAKFVNCHDARDGRWDGRGPAVTQVRPPRDGDSFRHRRYRHDNEDFYPRTRDDRRTYRHRDVYRDANWPRWENRDRRENRERRVRRHRRNQFD